MRFQRPSPQLQARREALKLLENLQADHAQSRALSPREQRDIQALSQALNKALMSLTRSHKLKLLSAHPVELSEAPPIRAQEHLIYLTLTQRLTLGEERWVRAQLVNRSQPPFTLSTISLKLPNGDVLPVLFEPKALTAQPDGQAQAFAFMLPMSALKNGGLQPTLSVRSTDDREVSLTLPEEP